VFRPSDISLPISFSRGGLGGEVLVRGWIALVREEKLFFLDSPSVDEDTIPLVRVEKLFFWVESRGHVGSLG
jgi:hypothetical protein